MRISLAEPMTASVLPIEEIADERIANIPFSGISTDADEVKAGDLFLAFRGARHDGNDFIEQAFFRGAVLALSETRVGKRILRCKNLILLLYDLAAKRLSEISPQVVAVTGSVGKTTFISYASALLDAHVRLHLPKGNHNTDIGLPLTVLAMPRETELLLLELGARQRGDIGRLSLLAKPSIAVMTRIGHSHLEGFGDLRGVLNAKSEILIGLRPNGSLIYNADDPLLSAWAKGLECDRIGVSLRPEIGELTLTREQDGTNTITYCGGRIDRIRLKNQGEASELAAALAATVALKIGLSPDEIRSGLGRCRQPAMRQESHLHNGILYIFDAYNASPESSEAALRLLSKATIKGRRFALLGDMLELGRDTDAHHFSLGIHAAKSNVDRLYCIGELSQRIAEGAVFAEMPSDRIRIFSIHEKKELSEALRHELQAGDALLLKASRALALEDILSDLTER